MVHWWTTHFAQCMVWAQGTRLKNFRVINAKDWQLLFKSSWKPHVHIHCRCLAKQETDMLFVEGWRKNNNIYINRTVQSVHQCNSAHVLTAWFQAVEERLGGFLQHEGHDACVRSCENRPRRYQIGFSDAASLSLSLWFFNVQAGRHFISHISV